MDNFNRHYTTNKSPFTINLKTNTWFGLFENAYRMKAFLQFLTDIQLKTDVYVVSMSKVYWRINKSNNSDKLLLCNPFDIWKN